MKTSKTKATPKARKLKFTHPLLTPAATPQTARSAAADYKNPIKCIALKVGHRSCPCAECMDAREH